MKPYFLSEVALLDRDMPDLDPERVMATVEAMERALDALERVMLIAEGLDAFHDGAEGTDARLTAEQVLESLR